MIAKCSRRAVLTSCLLLVANLSDAGTGKFDADNLYPSVGAIIAPEFRFFPLCSGVLIEESVFLTAGHCIPTIAPLFETTGGVWA